MDSTHERILEAIRANPGQRVQELVALTGIARSAVMTALNGSLRGSVWQDSDYRWYPGQAPRATHEDAGATMRCTPLSQLCQYYLACMSAEDLGGVSVFAESRYGAADYVELSSLPMLDPSGTDPFGSAPARALLQRVRRDPHRLTIFLGYPVRLNLLRSRKGWTGFMVEPLLLSPFQAEGAATAPEVSARG